MADLPAGCEILNNSAGTAQGMWFVQDGKHFISLPGVPFEMKAIYLEEIEHRLKERFTLPNIHHITLLTHGLPESMMATPMPLPESPGSPRMPACTWSAPMA